ncbi:MAG: M23 family metallopeptidase [Aeromonadaceae bacterium]|nr:M23 family metallopeptidase [Aeromonadaceae bacterium]
MRAWVWLALLAWPLQAAIFKYVDEQGIVNYTDDAARASPFSPQALDEFDPDPDKVKLRYSSSGNLYVLNELTAPVTVTLQLNRQQGVSSSQDLSRPILVAGRSERFVAQVSYQGQGRLEIRHHFVLGAMSPVSRAQLRPPFAGRFRVSQGFAGGYSHQSPGNRYAIDLAMPEGTPVLAAKAGVVVDFVDGYVGHTQDLSGRARTNYLRLLHPDGTLTLYAHLQPHSVRVGLGQSVSAGSWLASSGNTGYSTGPHLHFAVQRNDGQRLVAIPFTFHGQVPAQGDWVGG